MERLKAIPMFKQTCKIHSNFNYEYICCDSSSSFAFKCTVCPNEEDIPMSSLLSIRQVLSEGNRNIYPNFPKNDRPLLQKFIEQQKNKQSEDNLLQNLEQSLKDFRLQIIKKVDEFQQKMANQIKSQGDLTSSVFQVYDQICEKEQMQNILNDSSKSIETKSKEIQQVFVNILNKKTENSTALKFIMDRLDLMIKSIDFKYLEKVQSLILNKFDELDTFIMKGNANFNQNGNQMKKKDKQNGGATELMKLVRNQIYGIHEDICASLENQLNQIPLDFKIPESVNKKISQLKQLNESDIIDLNIFIKALSDEKQQQLIEQNYHQFDRVGHFDNFNQNQNQNKVRVDFKQKPKLFTHTLFEESNKIKIEDLQNGSQYFIFPKGKYAGNVVSEILDNEKAYKVKIEFNNPFGQNYSNDIFAIGLIRKEHIDTQYVLAPNYNTGFCSYLNKGATIKIKGSYISSSQLRKMIKSIEIRFCISKKQFYIADSTYSNINKVEESLLSDTGEFCFGVNIQSQNKYEWQLNISNIKEINPLLISDFD